MGHKFGRALLIIIWQLGSTEERGVLRIRSRSPQLGRFCLTELDKARIWLAKLGEGWDGLLKAVH